MTDQSMTVMPLIVMVLVGIVIPAALRAFDIGAMVAECLQEARITRKVAAGHLKATETQLSRWVSGRGPEHLSADRLTRLPRIFWLLFALRICEHFGVGDDAESRAAREARRMARQIKATLRDSEKEWVCA